MAILSDVFISTPADANRYDTEPESFGDVTLSTQGLTYSEFSVLWRIYQGQDGDDSALEGFATVMEMDHGERLINEFPDDLLNHLAHTDEEQLARVATAWATHEELGADPEDVEPYLRELVALAKRARAENKRMYLWMCV